ncbi:hypothetical protein MMC25_007419 [Agyrium rufum]|nr:hypothetical protein [Agyrium rufum]
MENGEGASSPAPPPRLFERLAQLNKYVWDNTIPPFHSSYDNWHVFGIQTTSASRALSTPPEPSDGDPDPESTRPALRHNFTARSDYAASDVSMTKLESESSYIPVVARISTHALRLEREYQLCRKLYEIDPSCAHTVRPIELVTLSTQQGDAGTVIVSIFESPGRNYLKDVVDFGPAFLGQKNLYLAQSTRHSEFMMRNDVMQFPVSSFLDFAIGACQCLELLHHGLKVVHGEVRGDAFHFNQENGVVKLINFGSGPRSFENGLTSAGWLALSREVGVKNKLQFIAPEQTGRMAAEPDTRTDIYSLGVLFWTLLTQEPAFPGKTPIDVVQSVLSRRIAPVSGRRIDVPEVISNVIQKMTRKPIDERYHSMSGLKHDFEMIQNYLGDGNSKALDNFEIGTRDVSSFFVLPTAVFGRDKQLESIVKVIDKAAKRQQAVPVQGHGSAAVYGLSSSSTNSERLPSIDGSSDTGSQLDSETRPAATVVSNGMQSSNAIREEALVFQDGVDTISTSQSGYTGDNEADDSSLGVPQARPQSSSHGRSRSNPIGADPRNEKSSSAFSFSNRDGQKFRRKGRCEVIAIYGNAGLGKSCLIQSVHGEIRRRGYLASGKFDSAQRAPFEPVLRSMSSLFRQIFSEADVSSSYHQNVRKNIKGIWPFLCKMLDLPVNLIYAGGEAKKPDGPFRIGSSSSKSANPMNIKYEDRDAQSLSTHSSTSGSGQLFRGPTNHSLKFMNTFLEVLRILSAGKLITLCLDDLQYADDESVELITNVINSRLKVVMILSCRESSNLPSKIKAALDSGDANLKTLQLLPLTDAEVTDYVAATLYRPREYVYGLAQVCLEKTNGNPFYMRQMLEECYRKNCLWYSWKDSRWEYDIDRVFAVFETSHYGEQLNTNFIIQRLQDQLPPVARSILAWASLLGNTFSFACVQILMSGEFDYDDGESVEACNAKATLFVPNASKTASVEGLQACIQAYVVVPGEDDDQFRFSHDRYMQASTSLRECHNLEKMHFVICQTLMKYFNLDERTLYTRARHVCQASSVIKRRIVHRSRFRELLFDAAGRAIDSGARASGLMYLENCIDLFQDNPWNDDEDVYYDETLSVYTKTAEVYWHLGDRQKARDLLKVIFDHARSPADKAPAWILQSRLYTDSGDTQHVFGALKTSLAELGLEFQRKTTWAACDKEYKELAAKLDKSDINDLINVPLVEDVSIAAMGSVMTEAVCAAFWSDSLLFYQLAIKMVRIHLCGKTFVQIGLGVVYFAIVGMNRFGDSEFSRRVYTLSFRLLRRFNDPCTLGRGLTIGAMFFAHLLTPIQDHLPAFEEAVDHTLTAGDKDIFLLTIGGLAASRLYLGLDMSEIESFCTYAAEDFGDWTHDSRGGVILMGVRQVARALQGKTDASSPASIMSDDGHDSAKYVEQIARYAIDAQRPRDIYNSFRLIPLFLFGHYDAVIKEGTELLKRTEGLWSIRNNRLILFYLSLAKLIKYKQNPSDKTKLLEEVSEYQRLIQLWMKECVVNYAMWSLLIEAEMREITGDYHLALEAYEAAIDHTQAHGFALEEGLAFELQAAFYERRYARRAARTTLEESIAAYMRVRATGKIEMMTTQHAALLSTTKRTLRADAGTQTVTTVGDLRNTQAHVEENERQENENLGAETRSDRTEAWLQPGYQIKDVKDGDTDVSNLGLDVLDLQSILEFNQVISSELQIDKLLAKLTSIILECSAAEFAGVFMADEEDGNMCLAASGTPDGLSTESMPLTEVKSEVGKQVVLYTLRFTETVFVQNVMIDERFSPNATIAKAVISLPILQGGQLLGVLYLEGQESSFTARNLSVLQLFCTQVGISIANAQLFRKIRKVSAANTSMIESQKRALAKAIEAENKAKLAEAEAMRNVRLKEEAARAKSMFLANVSHELRTPLNGVIGMSELLKGTELSKEQDSYADSIRVCADTLLTVINDILDFSKLEAGKMKLFSIPLNLHETITEVVRALSFTNTERDLKTLLDLELDRDLLVIGDPVRLHQIFMNLLSNAYKFTKPGGSVTIKARNEMEDENLIKVTCSVSDTGIGITHEQVSRLFMPFSQADSSTQRSYGGTGLGLSICKALVSILKGKIWLESRIGVGTTVSFTLTFPKKRDGFPAQTPMSPLDTDPLASWPDIARNNPSSPTLNSIVDLTKVPRDQIHICIAEDNPINQKIAVSFVTKLGFKCSAFSDGKAAVEAVREASKVGEPYHLVLMDVQMPVLDGYDATRLIRRDPDPRVRSILIIAMTASAIRGDREKCLEAGMNNYLAKPVRAAVLKSMLEEYLSKGHIVMPDLQETVKNITSNAVKEAEVAKRHQQQEQQRTPQLRNQEQPDLPTPPSLADEKRRKISAIRIGPPPSSARIAIANSPVLLNDDGHEAAHEAHVSDGSISQSDGPPPSPLTTIPRRDIDAQTTTPRTAKRESPSILSPDTSDVAARSSFLGESNGNGNLPTRPIALKLKEKKKDHSADSTTTQVRVGEERHEQEQEEKEAKEAEAEERVNDKKKENGSGNGNGLEVKKDRPAFIQRNSTSAKVL